MGPVLVVVRFNGPPEQIVTGLLPNTGVLGVAFTTTVKVVCELIHVPSVAVTV